MVTSSGYYDFVNETSVKKFKAENGVDRLAKMKSDDDKTKIGDSNQNVVEVSEEPGCKSAQIEVEYTHGLDMR